MLMYKRKQIVLWLLLIAIGLVFLLPFLVMVSTSFEYFTFALPFPPRLIPKEPVLDNYTDIIGTQHIFRYFLNSMVITAITASCSLFISCMAAYAFARLDFPGREAVFKLFLFTMMIPGILNIIPQFLIINQIGLIGTRAGLILLYIGTGSAGAAFFLRGFFESIPRYMDESVRLDGGNHWTIFSRVYLPLAAPGIATMSFFAIQGTWEEFFTAKVILGGNEKALTLPIILQRLNGTNATKFGLIFAACIITLIPVVILYMFVQRRYVVGGIMQGAVKM